MKIIKNETSQDHIPPELFKKIRKIEFKTKKILNEVITGRYHSVFKGQGFEFEDVREYNAGDDFRGIDWNVTARHNKLYVKRFREERELNVMLLIDVSGSLNFGSTSSLKSDKVTELAALISFTALSNQDKIGAVLFSDNVEKYIKPNKNKNNVLRMIRDILFHKNSSNLTDINSALKFTIENMKRRGIIFIISDFISELDFKNIVTAKKKHDIIPVFVGDKLEIIYENIGLVEMVDNETGRMVLVDTSSKAYKEFFKTRNDDIEYYKTQFKKNSIDPLCIDTDSDIEKVIVEYFNKRMKNYR